MGIVHEWWMERCLKLGWLGGIDGLRTEVVIVRQTATKGEVTHQVFQNWREEVPPAVKITQMGWTDVLDAGGVVARE